jgi:hypothetical protein
MSDLFNQQFMMQSINNEELSSSESEQTDSESENNDGISYSNSVNNMSSFNQTEDKTYEINLIENTNYIAINSKDRDWIENSVKTFNYYVKFNPMGDIYRKEYTVHELENSLINQQINQATYDNLLDKYHTIKGQSDNLHLLCDLRNIKEIELTYCIIPNIVIDPLLRHQEMTQGLNYGSIKTIKDYQYIQVELLETDGIWNGTNNSINKSIGMMVPDDIRCVLDEGTVISNNNDSYTRNYIVFRNIVPCKKIYHPNPRNNLNLISLRFLDPQGNELKLLNDNLTINNVNLEYQSDNIISIRLITNYFSIYEYKEGDTIILKNFKFKEFSTEFNVRKIEDYLSRDDGHKIIKIRKFIDDDFNTALGFNNCISILFPYKLNNTNGNLESDYQQFISTNLPTTDNIYNLNNNCNGNVLNLSMQHTVFFNITTLSRDIDFNSNIL